MKLIKKFEKHFDARLKEKENSLPKSIGKLGDGFGNLYADATRTMVWVRFGETPAIPVFCNRVAPSSGVHVVVGYAPEQPSLYQVLSTYTDKPGGDNAGTIGGYAPARRYEWLAYKGGQDPLYVHLRAFTPLGMYVTKPPSMSVNLMRGMIINASKTPIEVPSTTSDHTAYIPVTEGKAVLVLHTIDNDGANVETVSDEFDIDLLMPEGDRFANVPALPTDTVFVRGLVRVYYGQTKVQEARTDRDIIDMRFPGFYGGSAGAVAWSGIVGKPTTWDELWAELTGAAAGVAAIGNSLYVRKFLQSAAPTVDDDDTQGYLKTDEWFDQANSINYKCHDNATGAAVWIAEGAGAGSGDLNFRIDGTLAVLADVYMFIVTKDMTISKWYIHCDDNGSASSTIYDVHKNGVTIFTDQGNRPTLAHDDANGWAVSGDPDFIDFVEGDLLSIHIDQVATGAEGLTGAGLVSGSSGGGGSSFNLVVEDASATVSVSNVGKIIVPNNTLIDNGSGEIEIAFIPIKSLVATIPSGTKTTTSSSYADVDGATFDVTINKLFAGTDLIITLMESSFVTAQPTRAVWAVNDGTTDHDMFSTDFNAIQTHRSDAGMKRITGLAAGSWTFRLRWKRTSGTGTVTMDANDHVSISVEEVR